MNRPARRRRWGWPAFFLILLLAAVSLVAWQYHKRRYPSWDEEVRLSDVRVITVHQKHDYLENYGTHQSWVTIDLPELGGERVWHSFLRPQRIDVQGRDVFVFGKPRGIKQNQIYRYPKYYMVAFKWNGVEFQRIPFLAVPETLRLEENVFPCVPPGRLKRVTLARKSSDWCEPTGDRNQFGKQINLPEYQRLAKHYASLDGGDTVTD